MTPIVDYYTRFQALGKTLEELDEQLALYMKYGYMVVTPDDMILAHLADSTKIEDHQHIQNTIGQETDSWYINYLYGSMRGMAVFWTGIPHPPKEYVFFHRIKKGELKLSKFKYDEIKLKVTLAHMPL